MVSRNVADDRCERADAQLVVIRDRDVMLLRLVATQPDVAAGLPGDAVAERCEGFD